MNILIPDSWLREYLDTNATPHDIFTYLSLCGPSVERYEKVADDIVYDIEITTNRVDAYSVYGIAREAAVILPQFGFKTTLKPLNLKKIENSTRNKPMVDIDIGNDPKLCNRILAIKIENITLGNSPDWLIKRLEQIGERGLNNAIDITNYVAHEIGHPLHAFDYDRLVDKKIHVRLAKKGESLITLDNRKILLKGEEIVFENGKGKIIDLPGIMGTANTVVTSETKNVLLFSENSDPVKIRRASMTHAIRSHAAIVNEKSPDPELALSALLRAADLYTTLTKGKIGSRVLDIYPNKPKKIHVTVSENQISTYLGISLDSNKVLGILQALGCESSYSITKHTYTVTPPSFRSKDIQIPQDVIEEIARIFGYQNIPTKLPDTEPPLNQNEAVLEWEKEIKIRLRDWGYTETYTYSMISEKSMRLFNLDPSRAYKIANPLSTDWEYMRSSLWPSMLDTVASNQNAGENLAIFELSCVYEYRKGNLPIEKPNLVILLSGLQFLRAKGIAEALFSILGIQFPKANTPPPPNTWYGNIQLSLGDYGGLGYVDATLLAKLGIKMPITILELDVECLVTRSQQVKKYIPVSKYPAVFEDFSFLVPEKFPIGPLLTAMASIDHIIETVSFLDAYELTRTLRVRYVNREKNLSSEDVLPVRNKIIQMAEKQFHIQLKK